MAAIAPAAPPSVFTESQGTPPSDFVPSPIVARKRGEHSGKMRRIAAVSFSPSPTREVEATELPIQRCQWAVLLYSGGERTLARSYLQDISNIAIHNFLRGVNREGYIPILTPIECWRLLQIFQDRIVTPMDFLMEDTIRSFPCTVEPLSRLQQEERAVVHIFSKRCDKIIVKLTDEKECFPLAVKVASKINMNNLSNGVACHIMQFLGYVQPLATLSKNWRNVVHSWTSPFIPRILNHVDWLRHLFQSRLDADALFLLNDLVMQTVRELTENFTLVKEEIIQRIDNKLCRLLKRDSGYCGFQYYKKFLDQPVIMKLLIKKEPQLLANAPDSVKNDFDFIKELVSISGISIKDASEDLRAHPEIIDVALEQNPNAYEFILGSSRENELIVKKVLRFNGTLLRHLPTKMRISFEYLTIAITSQHQYPEGRGLAVLPYTSIYVWDNRELLELILTHNEDGESVLQHPLLPEKLRTDRDFNLKAVANNVNVEIYNTPFLNDFTFNKAIFLDNPHFFWNLITNEEGEDVITADMRRLLLADQELVLELIIEANDYSSHYAKLLSLWKSNSDIIEAAVLRLNNPNNHFQRDGVALTLADPNLLADPLFIRKIVSRVGLALQHIPPSILSTYDLEVFELALTNNGAAIDCVPPKILANNPRLYLLALKTNGLVWCHLSEELKKDPALARIAIKANFRVFEFFPLEFRDMAEFVEIAVKADSSMIRFASSDWLEKTEKFEQILRWNGLALEYALPKFHSSYHINKIAILENQDAYQFTADQYRKGRGILLSADLKASKPGSTSTFYRFMLGHHLKQCDLRDLDKNRCG